ncbi:cytochrome c-type biogenesis protein [Lysobacter sp. A03]|uniref:cytochrome c-type biogenesis protein n=1 Tax=Lysobacter sp. A03 TaxID=1199154 RepID=UPI0005B72E0C|nr:cytochrome c-type biogenesis protein [Lysobacter sp. A03]KIQ96637.1 Cytochrome c heme lyase subunit CcmL [Lysobacter sp. A03]
MRRRWQLMWVLVLLLPALAFAQAVRDPSPMQFTDQAEADRFHDLAGELRCVKCQNQSLADSNAAIAQDLRHEVLALMRQGKSNPEVKEYLVARYGEFVLYRPRMDTKTWLLWFGPALVLLAGAIVVVNVVRRHSRMAAGGPGDSPKATAAVDEDQEW